MQFDQLHWKPLGTLPPQKLTMRLRSMGMLRWMPRTLALMAVQRHTATSRSARPSMRGQQGSFGGAATVALISPFSTLAQTPSFSVSRGHLPPLPGPGVGVGLAQGLGGEGAGSIGTMPPPPQATLRFKDARKSSAREANNLEGMDSMIDPSLA